MSMDRLICPACGADHDASDMEPTYRRPDAYLAVPSEERQLRTIAGKDDCRVRDADDTHRQYFLRVRLPIPVRGESKPCCWGVWVEIDETSYERARQLWDDSRQDREPPFPGALANALLCYEDTVGLPGVVQLTGPTSVPTFTLAAHLKHRLAEEQRSGVYPERVVEWLAHHCIQ